jgi:hypothetical protein
MTDNQKLIYAAAYAAKLVDAERQLRENNRYVNSSDIAMFAEQAVRDFNDLRFLSVSTLPYTSEMLKGI